MISRASMRLMPWWMPDAHSTAENCVIRPLLRQIVASSCMGLEVCTRRMKGWSVYSGNTSWRTWTRGSPVAVSPLLRMRQAPSMYWYSATWSR